MRVKLRCPNPVCAKISSVPEELAGQPVKCPGCGSRLGAPMDKGSGGAQARPSGPGGFTSPMPERIGRFEVRQRLGAGAFGTVYRAYDPQLDREVALKVPNPGVLESPDRVERFLREAKAAAGLRHPNIVPVYDAGQDGGRYYIASAFIDGKPLAEAVEEGGANFALSARLVRALAEALAYAHEEGVVHRDVKPANCMLDAQDRLHLMDFGLAVRGEAESRLTTVGSVLGTPAYMAPEQAAGKTEEVGPASDQYACGVVLYELLTGQTPFGGPPAVVIHNQIHTEPDPPSKLRRDVPKDLETICLRSLAKQPWDRYLSCQALAEDLRRWLDGDPIRARPLSASERLVRWVRKNKAIAGLAASLSLALVAGVVVSLSFAAIATRQASRANQAAAAAGEQQKKALEAAIRERTERERATEQQKVAVAERNRATDALKELEQSREKLVASEKDARQAAEEASQSAEDAKRGAYNALVLLAATQVQSENSAQAFRSLDQCLKSQRGLEWRLLNRWAQAGRVIKTQFDHKGKVSAAAINPAKSIAAVASADGTISVYHLPEGTPVWSAKLHTAAVRQIAMSPDGTLMASCGPYDLETVKRLGSGRGVVVLLVEVASGKVIHTLSAPTNPVSDLAFDRVGEYLAVKSYDAGEIWTTAEGTLVKHFAENAPRSAVLTITPDNAAFTTGRGFYSPVEGEDWDTARAKLAETVSNHSTTALRFSNSARWLAGAGDDKSIEIKESDTGKVILSLHGHNQEPRHLRFLDEDHRLVSAGDDGVIKLWDLELGSLYVELKEAAGPVIAMDVAPDESWLTAVYATGRCVTWPLSTPHEAIELSLGQPQLRSLIWSDSGKLLATNSGRTIRVWELPSGKLLKEFQPKQDGSFCSLAIDADGKTLAAGVWGGSILTWEIESGKPGPTYAVGSGYPHQVAFSKDRRRIFVIESSVGAGASEFLTISTETGSVAKFRLAGSDFLVTDRDHNHVCFWQAEGLALQDAAVITQGTTYPKADLKLAFGSNACFGADGLIVLSDGRRACVLDPRTKGVKEIPTGERTIENVAFHPSRPIVAVATGDESIRFYDAKTGVQVGSLQGQKLTATGLAFSPDGKWLATGSLEAVVRVWDVEAILPETTRSPPDTKKQVPRRNKR